MIRESKDCSCSVNHIVCMFGEILRSKSKQGAPDIYEREDPRLEKILPMKKPLKPLQHKGYYGK